MPSTSQPGTSHACAEPLVLDVAARRALMGHGGAMVWLTGLSGAGKSTIANALERRLHDGGCHTFVLDGDSVRRGLCRDLGFSAADRTENIRRVAEVGGLMVQAGLVVVVAAISPFRADRRLARERLAPAVFIEVHVDVSLAVAEARDPKGLYRRARQGLLRDFTGIDSPYEPPERPELRVDTRHQSAAEAAEAIHGLLQAQGVLARP